MKAGLDGEDGHILKGVSKFYESRSEQARMVKTGQIFKECPNLLRAGESRPGWQGWLLVIESRSEQADQADQVIRSKQVVPFSKKKRLRGEGRSGGESWSEQAT